MEEDHAWSQVNSKSEAYSISVAAVFEANKLILLGREGI
jgi:hypothetical protein